MTREARRNAYLYCKFRDEQFALYDEYAKSHGMPLKTLLVANVLFYAEDGMTQKEICQRTFQSKQTVNLIIKNFLADGHVTAISHGQKTPPCPCLRKKSKNSLWICPDPLQRISPCW